MKNIFKRLNKKQNLDKSEIWAAMMLKNKGIEPEEGFVQDLELRLLDQVKTEVKSPTFSFNYLKVPALALSLLIIIFAILTYFLTPVGQRKLITVAQAKEELRKELDSMFKKGTIFHEITSSTSYDDYGKPIGNTAFYESWTDQNSNKRRIQRSANNYIFDIEINDGDINWEYDPKDKVLYKTHWTYEDPEEKNKPFEVEDLVKKLKLLLNSQSASIKEETLDGKNVITFYEEFPITQSGDEPKKSQITKYIFDKESFTPLEIVIYNQIGDKLTIQNEDKFILTESLPRTQNLLDKYFKFDLSLNNNFSIIDTNQDRPKINESPKVISEVSPFKYVIGDKNLVTFNLSIYSWNNAVVRNAKYIQFGQYENAHGEDEFVSKYQFNNQDSVNPNEQGLSIAGLAIPNDLMTGIYYIRLLTEKGETYITKDTIEIVNNSSKSSNRKSSDIVTNNEVFPCLLSPKLSVDAKALELVVLENTGGEDKYIDKYSYKNVYGENVDGKNPGAVLCGDFPENVKSGTYYIKAINPDGSIYVSQDTLEVFNDLNK